MTQNIYDSPAFFEGYSQLPRSVAGFEGAPEWASIKSLIPDLKNSRVADLGCGFGWFCRWAREQGASEVFGVDVSQNMLSRAKEMTKDPGIHYEQADLEEVSLGESTYDLVYSSLTFHYLENLEGLIEKIHRALQPGGWLVFSAEHPVFTAPSNPEWTQLDGHQNIWPVNQYLVEGPRITNWLADGVTKQHRTLGTYVNMLLRQGLVLKHLEEWRPTAEQIDQHPELKIELERPMFFIAAAQRA